MKITRKDLEWAADQNVITHDQATSLWHAFEERLADKPRFDLIHIAYYFGALLVIGAMGWFMGEAWEDLGGGGIFTVSVLYAALFLGLGAIFWSKAGYRVPGGLLITISVCMTPLATYGLQRALDLWAFDDPGSYTDFHRWIRGGWFVMEVATICMALLALKFFRFPFLTAPLAFALWYMSMDLTPIIAGEDDWGWMLRREVSVVFGFVMLIGAYLLDRKVKTDYAFWIYLFGLLAFWCGLSTLDSGSELNKFLYFVVNLFLILLSSFLRRKVFLVFGALGVMGYLGHLAFDLFDDSTLFPVVLTLFGGAIIAFGIALKKAMPKVNRYVEDHMPTGLRSLRPVERSVTNQ